MILLKMASRINRRDFLGLIKKVPEVAAAAVVATAVGTKVVDELEIIEKSMFSHGGVKYQPIYENHNMGAEVNLHPRVSGVFVEYSLLLTIVEDKNGVETVVEKTNHFNADPENIQKLIPGNSAGKAYIAEEVRKRRIALAFGDVALIENSKDTDVKDEMNDDDKREFALGALLSIGGSFAPRLLETIVKEKMPEITRRQFIEKMAGLGVAVSLMGIWKSTGTATFKGITADKASLENQYEPINRLLLRLYGMASDTHTDSPVIFMRNLIMALKVKQFGEYLKLQGIEDPIVAFDVGGAHSGIEDFICLPEDVLRYAIVNLSGDYVRRAMEEYGDNVARTRVIKTSGNGQFYEAAILEDKELLKLIDSSHSQ